MEEIPNNIKNFPLLNDVIFKRVFTKKEQIAKALEIPVQQVEEYLKVA